MYSALRRPKRKLCYVSNKQCPSKEWAGKVSLGDIDKMFDDLDTSSHDEDDDLTPWVHIPNNKSKGREVTSPVLQQKRPLTKDHPGHKGGLEKDVSPESKSLSPELDIGLDCPFKTFSQVKTSSPIGKRSVGDYMEDVHNRKEGLVSPILFPCEDNGTEEANMDNSLSSTCSEVESPPIRVTLKKCKMSYDKDMAQILRPKSPGSPVSVVRQTPGATTPVTKSKSAPEQPLESTRVERDMTTFLQKLRDTVQPKPSRPRKSVTPVKVSSPPLSEDDFLILEDNGPLWFSIPSKAGKSKKYSTTSSTDKDSSAEKGAQSSSPATAPKQPQTDQADGKLEPQTARQKGKKKGSEKNKAPMHGNKVDDTQSPDDPPSDDAKEAQKSSKSRRPRKVPSEDHSKAEEQPQITGRRANAGRGKPAAKKGNGHKNSRDKKTVNDEADIKIHKPSKLTRKVPQDMAHEDKTAQSQELDCIGHADVEDNTISDLKAELEEKNKQGELPAVSEESSPGDSLVIRKRKRREPGEWWVSSSQRAEETDVTGSQTTAKKSKQSKREPKTLSSLASTKKDGAAKRRTQKQPAQSPFRKTKTQTLKKRKKEKGDKQDNNLNFEDSAPGRRKLFDEVEVEESEQQGVMDEDPGPLHSSPLPLPERDRSLNSSMQVFQKVYQHITSETKPRRPGAASASKKSVEQPAPEEPGKRRRRPPNNWWMVTGSSDDVESGSSQPLKQEVKPRKAKRKAKQIKSPGLKTPQDGNVSISPIPAEGAPAPLLRVKPLSAPKTIKRSLATFKDIFTSAAETPGVRGRRKSVRNSKHKLPSSPAVENTECAAGGEEGVPAVISMDAGDSKLRTNQEPPETSRNQSDNILKSLRSGPSSMIELQQYEDNDEMSLDLPSSRLEPVLSASDLCGPPLKPLFLQLKDKANLTQWFKSLWSVTADRGPEIAADDFAWYYYKGRAIGIQEDLTCGSICNGKLLLGSFMKKPLWVDHSANTVFNLLTSSIKVSINGREARFAPSQSFMVQIGEAYSIQNLTAQPAVLYFTRIFAESSD